MHRVQITLLIVLTLAFLQAQAGPSEVTAEADTGANVILITWDGIRLDEFLGRPDATLSPDDGAPTLPHFWSTLAPLGQVYGDGQNDRYMTAGNLTFVSLPGYQAIMAGTTQPCWGNDCGPTKARTIQERLVRERGLAPMQVATVASWRKIAYAVERQVGTGFVNAGQVPLVDGTDDFELAAINSEQAATPAPWPDARLDEFTHRHAMRYLKTHKPRFLYVSYNDSDEWAHRGNYPEYLAAIRRYDTWLEETVEALRALGDYGKKTCIMITTDHGRGLGDKWATHSNGQPYSGLVWLYAGCPLAEAPAPFAPARPVTTHLDIRPTIEQLFSLKPRACLTCGRSLLTGRLP